MVRFGVRVGPKVSGGFSSRISCAASEDSTTSIRGASLDDAVWCCANDSASIADTKNDRLAASDNRVDGNTAPPPSVRLSRILRNRWRSRAGSFSFFLETLLNSLSFFVLQSLESSKGFLRVFDAVQPPVNNAELIPSLLDDLRIGVR